MSQKWNSNVSFPKDNYVLRCTEESFGPSKASGKPMITLEHEIVSPEEIDVDGVSYTVAGTPVKTYHVTQSVDGEGVVDAEKTQSIANGLEKLYAAYGLDFTNFNPENPALGFKGKLVYVLLKGEVTEQRKSPTSEQIKKGEKGDILKNPVTGKPLVKNYPKVDEFFGLAPAGAGPY